MVPNEVVLGTHQAHASPSFLTDQGVAGGAPVGPHGERQGGAADHPPKLPLPKPLLTSVLVGGPNGAQ